MKTIFIFSLILGLFFSATKASAELAPVTLRSVECSLNYVDFVNSENHLAYSLYAPRVVLKSGVLKTSSEHAFLKTIYSSRCQRCGPSHTLGPIVNPNSAFKSWVESTVEVPKLKVFVELERVLDTQPKEILSLRVSVKDETDPNAMTMSALDSETSLSFQTRVNGVAGVLNINCRIVEP